MKKLLSVLALMTLLPLGYSLAHSMPNRVLSTTTSAQSLSAPSNSIQLKHSQLKNQPKSTMHTSDLRFTVIDFGHTPLHEGFTPQPRALVFQDQTAWASFWQSSDRLDINLQKTAAPVVDFTNQTIIGVTAGSHRTGGYGIQIDRIEKVQRAGGDRWLLHYSEIVPAETCPVTQAPTTPVGFISIPKSTLAIELQGKQVTEACR